MANPTRSHSSYLLPALAIVAVAIVASVPAGTSRADSALIGCVGQPDGTACNDGLACTSGETCRSGKCLAPASFAAAAGSPIAVGNGPNAVVARDLNGDGSSMSPWRTQPIRTT
jgi:hypothetical protein